MLKKLAVGGVVAALIALLVLGAINRTIAKTGDESVTGRGRTAQGETVAQGGGRWSQNQASPGAEQNEARGGGRGSQAANPSDNDQAAVPQEWQSVSGVVQSSAADMLLITLASGETMELGGRPWSYAQEIGFKAAIGNEISLYGFQEDGEFKAARLTNQSTGKTVTVRDDGGRPMWSGRGRTG